MTFLQLKAHQTEYYREKTDIQLVDFNYIQFFFLGNRCCFFTVFKALFNGTTDTHLIALCCFNPRGLICLINHNSVVVSCARPVGGSMCSPGAEGEERLGPERPRGVPGCTADATAANDRWAHHLCWIGV